MSTHRSSSRVIREIMRDDGTVHPMKGLGFGLSSIDDEASRTAWERKLPRRVFVESLHGQVLAHLPNGTDEADALQYRDRYWPSHRLVIWQARANASAAEAATSGTRRVFEPVFAAVAKKPTSKGQLRRAGIKKRRK